MQDGETAAGSVNSVQRVGDTVRRPSGAWTPAVQHFLRFLERREVEGIPRALGTDEQGREVVSYLAGKVAMRPWPAAMLDGSGCVDAARWLQNYLEAAAGYEGPPEDACWRDPAAVCGEPGEVVLHSDLGPWNMVFSDDSDGGEARFVGVIDWDLAQPGRPELSMGQLAYYHAPLRDDEHAAQCGFGGAAGVPLDRGARLRRMGDVFGKSAEQLVQAALEYLEDEVKRTRRLGAAGIEPWAAFLSRGDCEELQGDRDWIAARRDELAAPATAAVSVAIASNPHKSALPDASASAAEAVCTEPQHRQRLLERRRQLLLQCALVGALDEERLAELLEQLDQTSGNGSKWIEKLERLGDAVDAAGARPPRPAAPTSRLQLGRMGGTADVLAALQAAAGAAAEASGVGGAVVSIRVAADSPLLDEGERGCIGAGHELSAAAGWADSAGRAELTPTSRLCWGSCTKTFVAAAVLRASEAGLLSLDDAVAAWVDPLIAAAPRMPAGRSVRELFGAAHAGVTVRQLLQMRSGICDFENEGRAEDGRTSYEMWWAEDAMREWTPVEQLAWASVAHGRPPHFTPDAAGGYSSTNYALLGLVLQAAHKLARWQDVEALLLEMLPAEARETTRFPSAGTCKTNGAVHAYSSDPERPDMWDEYPIGAAWTAGNVVATAAGMTAWLHALFCVPGAVVSPGSLAQMSDLRAASGGFAYGLGLHSARMLGIPTAVELDAIGHGGGIAGFSSAVLYIPEWRLCMAAIVNDAYPSEGKEGLTAGFADAVLAGLRARFDARQAAEIGEKERRPEPEPEPQPPPEPAPKPAALDDSESAAVRLMQLDTPQAKLSELKRMFPLMSGRAELADLEIGDASVVCVTARTAAGDSNTS
jgi:CubicO group peptidase (beta-lactamase class C family)